MRSPVRVKLLGVRGSAPVHGSAFARFGGATSCVLIEAGSETLILDAGSGLTGRAVGETKRFSMLLSHAHADHLLGFPLFSPLFDADVQCDVYLKTRNGLCAERQIEALMSPPLWPIRPNAMKADLRFHDVADHFSIGDIQVDTMEGSHPGGATIYKIRYEDVSIVYATDYEPISDAPEDFCAFAKDCSLLLLDAQYLNEEYERTKGFGHSTIQRSVAIAMKCNAAQTRLLHHDPNRTDAQLDALDIAVSQQAPSVRFGREEEEVSL